MMSRAVAAFGILLLTCTWCGRSLGEDAPPENPVPETSRQTEAIRQAAELFQQGNPVESLKLLQKAKQDDPKIPPARFMFAKLCFAANQTGPARAALEQAVVDEPDYPGTYVALGLLGLREGRLTDAQLEFEKGIAILQTNKSMDEDDAKALRQQCHLGIATVAERRNDWGVAKAELTAWLTIQADDVQARQRLARAEFKLGDHKAAYEELKRAAQAPGNRKPEPPEISMVRFYSSERKHAKAEEWLNFSLKQDPDNVRVRMAAAGWYLDRGRPDEALKNSEAAARLSPESNDVKIVRGLVARHRKEFAEAERFFEQIYSQSPGDFLASNQLALSLADQDDPAKQSRAQQLADVNVRQYPRNAEALATAGWVNYRQGKLEAAERLLNTAVSGGRASSDIAYFIARVKIDQGQLNAAQSWLEQALNSDGAFVYRDDARARLKEITAKTSKIP